MNKKQYLELLIIRNIFLWIFTWLDCQTFWHVHKWNWSKPENENKKNIYF